MRRGTMRTSPASISTCYEFSNCNCKENGPRISRPVFASRLSQRGNWRLSKDVSARQQSNQKREADDDQSDPHYRTHRRPKRRLEDVADNRPPPGNGQQHPSQTTQQTEQRIDRKSTRLNSSHVEISYAVFCLKKK